MEVSAPPGMEGSFPVLPGDVAAPAGNKPGCSHPPKGSFRRAPPSAAASLTRGPREAFLWERGGRVGGSWRIPMGCRLCIPIYPDISRYIHPGVPRRLPLRVPAPARRRRDRAAPPTAHLHTGASPALLLAGGRRSFASSRALSQWRGALGGRGPVAAGSACAALAPPPFEAGPGLAGLGWAGLCRGWAELGRAPGTGKKGRRAGLAASPVPAIAESTDRLPRRAPPRSPSLGSQ